LQEWHGLQILSITNDSYLIIFILYQAWNPRQRGTIEIHYTFDGQKLGKKVYGYRGNLTLNERNFDELLMQNGKLRRLARP
jgi:hypothetical protein